MIDYSAQNKKAWEYNAYEFWVKQDGTPSERAKRDKENPIGMLKRYSVYFDTYNNIRVANICGSCGKKAIPLAVLGADVTRQMPKCSYRRYTVSEIINAVISSGFVLNRFDEHPSWTNSKMPGEFTILASK